MKVKIRLYEDRKYQLLETKQYLKDKKKILQSIKNKNRFIERLNTILDHLANDSGYSLDPAYNFHYLEGKKGIKSRGDVHILPDWVLVFTYNRPENMVNLEYISNHSNMKEDVKRIKRFKSDDGFFSVYDIDTTHNRADMFTVLEDRKGWIVRNALVPDNMQKQGIATNFYIKMNNLSMKKTGYPLRSTQPRKLLSGQIVHELSIDGIRLWDSLVRKGLAVKLSDKNYKFL